MSWLKNWSPLISVLTALCAVSAPCDEVVAPEAAYSLAQTIAAEALNNPDAARSEYHDFMAQIVEAMPFQNLNVIPAGSAAEQARCFGKNPLTGEYREFAAITYYSKTRIQFSTEAHPAPPSDTILFCPPAFNRGDLFAAHTILHELGHVVHGINECFASGIAMTMFNYAGRKAQIDGYTSSCGLEALLKP